MQHITEPRFRYGDTEFDLSYLEWGLHDRATQIDEADSLLRLVSPRNKPMRILDLACGVGTHAVRWATRGHDVTAIDISETFLARGRATAEDAGVDVDFRLADVRDLPDLGSFDLITWIEKALYEPELLRGIVDRLRPDGVFVEDVRNPDHRRTRQRTADWRTWHEEAGVFHLERHEIDPESGFQVDEWIEIDTVTRVVRHLPALSRPFTLGERLAMLASAGFAELRLHGMDGAPFDGGPEPYWLWLIARLRPHDPAPTFG